MPKIYAHAAAHTLTIPFSGQVLHGLFWHSKLVLFYIWSHFQDNSHKQTVLLSLTFLKRCATEKPQQEKQTEMVAPELKKSHTFLDNPGLAGTLSKSLKSVFLINTHFHCFPTCISPQKPSLKRSPLDKLSELPCIVPQPWCLSPF